jgi:hypothetical protein
MSPPLGAEDLDEQVRAAVRDQVLLLEVRRRVHEHEELDHTSHPVELADLAFQAREQVQHRQARRLLAGGDVQVGAELSPVCVLAVPVGPVARHEHELADRYGADVVRDRRGRRRQRGS